MAYCSNRHTYRRNFVIVFVGSHLKTICSDSVSSLLYVTEFPSEVLRSKPLIHQGNSRSYREKRQGSDVLGTRGGVLIRFLWNRHTGAIIDVNHSNADVDTYRFNPMETLLYWWDKIKKDEHSKHCRKQRNFFLCYFFLLMTC